MKSLLFVAIFVSLLLSSISLANDQAAVITLNGKFYVMGLAGKNVDAPAENVDAPTGNPPERFNGSPTGTLNSSTTLTALSLNTDVSAECRYQATWPGLVFETMTPFTETNSTFHYQLITVQHDEEGYTYSVRCKNNTTGISNQDNYNIIFSVGSSDVPDVPGEVGPVRSNGQPTGVLDAGTTETTLSVNTNVIAECRYQLFAAGLTFDTMTPFTTTNATLHTVLITGLTDGGNFVYSVRCKGTAGVANEQNFNIPFSIDVAL